MEFSAPEQLHDDDMLLAKLEPEFGRSLDTHVSSHERTPPFRIEIQRPKANTRLTATDARFTEQYAGPGRTAVIIDHGLTPFPAPGRTPRGVWGIGYEVSFPDQKDIETKEWLPTSKEQEIGNITVLARLASALGGGVNAALPNAGPVDATGKIQAEGSLNFGVELNRKLHLNVLEIVAGGVDNGVMWQVYSQGSSLLTPQRYIQLITVPTTSLTKISVHVRAWVRARGWFGFHGTMQWNIPDHPFTLLVE